MSLSYINTLRDVKQPNMWLCKPDLNYTIVGKIKDSYNKRLLMKLGSINELTFTVPYYVERNHENVVNPIVERFNGQYQIKFEYDGMIEYFMCVKQDKRFGNDGYEVSYTFYSSGYILSKKIIRGYSEETQTLKYHADLMLNVTDWTTGYISNSINSLFRTIESSEANILELMYQLAEKYGAIIKFDTLNRTVNFYSPTEVGINKGMSFKEGITLESYNVELNLDNIVTRLYVYGQDGLEFRRLTSNGVNYIQSFDWFIHPFKQDIDGSVLEHSYHMTDDLCKAIIAYENKIQQYKGSFQSALSQKESQESLLFQYEQELSVLESSHKIIEDSLWSTNKTKSDMEGENERQEIEDGTVIYPPNVIAQYEAQRVNLVNQKNNNNNQITAKNNQIQVVRSQIQAIDNTINNIRLQLQESSNFTVNQLKELNKFIQQAVYTNDSIVEDSDLLNDGIKEFDKIKNPPLSASIDIYNFTNDIDFELIKDRLSLGDTATLKSRALNNNIEAQIIELNLDFDNEDISVVLSNEREVKDGWEDFKDRVYKATETSTTVGIDKSNWNIAPETAETLDEFLSNPIDTDRQEIVGGYEGLTVMDRNAIKSYDAQDSSIYLFINNGVMGVTNNDLNQLQTLIDKSGIQANKIVGNLILSREMAVRDEQGTIEMKSGIMTIYDANDTKLVQLGKYQSPDNPNVIKTGLYIPDGSMDIRTSSNGNRGLQLDVNGIRTFNNSGQKTFEVVASTGNAYFMGNISASLIQGSDIRGGTLDIGNGVFKVDEDGNAEMTSATISSTPSSNMYVSISGYSVRGGDLEHGSAYTLGVTAAPLLPNYRAGYLRLADYMMTGDDDIDREMQLSSNVISVRGSNLVLGGRLESHPTIITRQINPSDNNMSVDSSTALYVKGDLEVSGDIYMDGDRVATRAWVRDQLP